MPKKFWEYPITSVVQVDTCTHIDSSSTIEVDVLACKALDATTCIDNDECQIQIAQVREKVVEGRTWEMVKWLPESNANWFSGDDNLAGTAAAVGTAGDASQEWSIPYDLSKFTYFMFTREGSSDYYQIMDKAFLNLNPATGLPTVHGSSSYAADVLKSTNSANPS